MIIIDNKLVSDELLEEQFVCDLSKCKGGCCEDGDAGAAVVDATGRGEGLTLFRGHAQHAAQLLAIDEAEEEQGREHQREGTVVGDHRLGNRRPCFANE